MIYKFSTYTFPRSAVQSDTECQVPCLPLTQHFIATPPLWDTDTPKEQMLRELPTITHKISGMKVIPGFLDSLKQARFVARVLEALPQDWDNPKWDDFPEWARRYMLQFKG